MLRTAVRALILRELGAVRRSLEAYPDDASVWAEPPGLSNPGGTLALHVAGALKHQFVDRDGTLGRMIPWLGRR